MSEKRKDYLEEEDYFMAVALLASKHAWGKYSTIGGACIVDNKKRVIGIGYADKEIHAVANAIFNKNLMDASGATMYVSKFPCNKCAQLIIQSGIKLLVHMPDAMATYELLSAKFMFDGAKPKLDYKEFIPKGTKISM